MITEDYVSFEVAKLLKDKGFTGDEIHKYYDVSDEKPILYSESYIHEFDKDFWMKDLIMAPTLQMAMKWLREVHNIHIAIVPCEVGPGVMDYTYILYKVDTENFIFKDLEIQGRANTDKMSASKTCEAAIKYCLENLINYGNN